MKPAKGCSPRNVRRIVAHIRKLAKGKTLEECEGMVNLCRMGKLTKRDQVVARAWEREVWARHSEKVLKTPADVAHYLGVDTEDDDGKPLSLPALNESISRCLYSNTGCGAWGKVVVVPRDPRCPACKGSGYVLTHEDRAGEDGGPLEMVVTCNVCGGTNHAFQCGSIVEGTDAEVEADNVFLPCVGKDIDQAVAYVEAEADVIWNDTHGCDHCGCDGGINPECKVCHGEGVIR